MSIDSDDIFLDKTKGRKAPLITYSATRLVEDGDTMTDESEGLHTLGVE